MKTNAPSSQAVAAIQNGEIETLRRLLTENPRLANERADGQRTLLHVATDWPGHFPNNAATVATLIDFGADPNAAFVGQHSERPLHWASSTDDVEVLTVLLDRGAEIEAPGSVIGGGSALADAVAFGQWRAARLLVERGARVSFWQAAALGLVSRMEEYLTAEPRPTPAEITNAFWNACHGGQLATAKQLLGRGADLNWLGHGGMTPKDAAVRAGAGELTEWLTSRGARSAGEVAGRSGV